MAEGKLWTERDRFGNDIYLTEERWKHVIDPDNHPEVKSHLDHLAITIRQGRRQQDAYDQNSYKYFKAFSDLPDENTHVVVCVRFRWATDADGTVHEEKFVTTAYLQAFEE